MIITNKRLKDLHKKFLSHTMTAIREVWGDEGGFFVGLPITFWANLVTNPKYVNSVQNVSITISAAATTGTQSVSAAAGTFFLIYQGTTTTAVAVQSEAFCRVSISGTTVTATRSLGTLGVCVVNAIVVDATSNLVNSVAMGTITVSSGTSATATISSVTTTNSAVHLAGYTTSLGTFNYGDNTPTLVLTNATTVTSTVRTLSGTCIASFVVVNFNASALNQNTQAFSKSWTNSAVSSTQVITSVNVNNAMLFFAGCDNDANETTATDQQTCIITSSTVVTVQTGVAQGDSAIVVNFTVIEFKSGVLAQNAQRGTIATSAATSNTATITSASTTNTICNFTGYRTATTAVTTYATILPKITQTNATTITETLNSAGSVTIAYEALTFN